MWKAGAQPTWRRLGVRACGVLRAFPLAPRPLNINSGVLWEFGQEAKPEPGGYLLTFHLLTPTSTREWNVPGPHLPLSVLEQLVRARGNELNRFSTYMQIFQSELANMWRNIISRKPPKQHLLPPTSSVALFPSVAPGSKASKKIRRCRVLDSSCCYKWYYGRVLCELPKA